MQIFLGSVIREIPLHACGARLTRTLIRPATNKNVHCNKIDFVAARARDWAVDST
jgi:hypothetical protein